MINVVSDTRKLRELIGSRYIGISAQLKLNSAKNSIILGLSDGVRVFLIDLQKLEGDRELEQVLT